ncbi:diaminopimelate decarboxylase [Alkalibacterium sp.]
MTSTDFNKRLMDGMTISEENHLKINGVDTVALAEKYGTPLYVYDIDLVLNKIRSFKDAFKRYEKKTQVAYASKAFSSLALYERLAGEDVSLDVVSGGELYLALKAGFPADRIHFHGNNKSSRELREAIANGIGCIVLDNFIELTMLEEITEELQKNINVLIRVTPGIHAHTHDYISTGQEDSKFGFDLASGQVEKVIERLMSSTYINAIGLHAHIGSQIFEVSGYEAVIDKLMKKADEWRSSYQFNLEVLNVGGGFGIRYVENDAPLSLSVFAEAIMTAVKKFSNELNLELPEIWIEPGRSIVGEAGTTLYTVGTEKEIPEVRKYISVDGGMADNIRPALYQATYTGVLANRVNDDSVEKVSVAGKACESGDMLIWDIELPEINQSDILAVFSTGAYGYSMASNYNRLPRPAVVFLENGEDSLAIRRETYDDYLNLEISHADRTK